ncbi:MAG: dockerin type I repeat-containing protein [Acutalibacteraceae bacterium]|nr:dockerin type I repeat-containing protein [Clostridia bacterium]MEE0980370.1 dockerin type I repeat-containing protein [Acutalibacteraceae bacterium]
MNSKKFRTVICIVLSLVMILPCFTVSSFAADVTVVKKPTKTTFYQGIDWSYNKSGVISVIGGSLDISGTVLSYNSKEVSYAVGKWPNMYTNSDSGSWSAGKNTMRIYCNDFPSNVYATVQVNLVEVESITVVTSPKKTSLIQDVDWKLSGLGDVEFTELDLTGLSLNVKYKDGISKIVSFPENKLISWAVPQGVDSIEPGKATLYATFGGKRAPFDVNFIRKGEKLSGDVSGDFKINSQDALMILQHSVGAIVLDDSVKVIADVSKDEKINSSDALMILQYSVGLIPSL